MTCSQGQAPWGAQSTVEGASGGATECLTPAHMWGCSNAHTEGRMLHTCSRGHTSACTQFRAMCTQTQAPTDPHRPEKQAESNTLHSALPGPEVSPSLFPLPLPPPSNPPPKPRASSLLSSLLLLAKTGSQGHNGPARPAQIKGSLGAFQRPGLPE